MQVIIQLSLRLLMFGPSVFGPFRPRVRTSSDMGMHILTLLLFRGWQMVNVLTISDNGQQRT